MPWGIWCSFLLASKIECNLVMKQEEIVMSEIWVEVERSCEVENSVRFPCCINSTPTMRWEMAGTCDIWEWYYVELDKRFELWDGVYYFLVIWLQVFVDWVWVDQTVCPFHHYPPIHASRSSQTPPTSDEENQFPPVPPPQMASRKSWDNLSDNVQLPNRTCGTSECTALAKQQAISEFFNYLLLYLNCCPRHLKTCKYRWSHSKQEWCFPDV